MEEINCSEDAATDLAKQILNLLAFVATYNSSAQGEDDDHKAVSQSEETLYVAEEEEKLKSVLDKPYTTSSFAAATTTLTSLMFTSPITLHQST